MNEKRKNYERANRNQIPGMRSDVEPQPKEDPDFGPGLEYESGDLGRDFSEADRIRENWKKSSRTHRPAPT